MNYIFFYFHHKVLIALRSELFAGHVIGLICLSRRKVLMGRSIIILKIICFPQSWWAWTVLPVDREGLGGDREAERKEGAEEWVGTWLWGASYWWFGLSFCGTGTEGSWGEAKVGRRSRKARSHSSRDIGWWHQTHLTIPFQQLSSSTTWLMMSLAP